MNLFLMYFSHKTDYFPAVLVINRCNLPYFFKINFVF